MSANYFKCITYTHFMSTSLKVSRDCTFKCFASYLLQVPRNVFRKPFRGPSFSSSYNLTIAGTCKSIDAIRDDVGRVLIYLVLYSETDWATGRLFQCCLDFPIDSSWDIISPERKADEDKLLSNNWMFTILIMALSVFRYKFLLVFIFYEMLF